MNIMNTDREPTSTAKYHLSLLPQYLIDRWLSREPSKTHLKEDLAPDDMR